MKKQLTLWVQVEGRLEQTALTFANQHQGIKAGTTLLVRRPEVEAVELRGSRDLLWRSGREDWEGWL